MGLNNTLLNQAILEKLQDDDGLVHLTKDGAANNVTGQTNIAIAEAYPETVQQVPFVGFYILNTKSLTPDDPTTGYFKSLVSLYSIGGGQLQAALIADRLQYLFTRRPEGKNTKWFCNLSNDCITTQYTAFKNRIQRKIRNRGKSDYNADTDTYMDAVIIEIIWTDSPCSGVCCEFEQEICPIQDIDSNYDPCGYDCDQ